MIPAAPETVRVRPVELVAGDRLLIGADWYTVASPPVTVRVAGRSRCRVQTVQGVPVSWSMDDAARFEAATIAVRAEARVVA